VSRHEPAETACGADQGLCETPGGFGRLASCFYATSFAARTAKSTAIGASWRTVGYPAAGRCGGMCFTWARSTTASAPRDARRPRRSMRAGRPANRSRCFPRIVRRRRWVAMWCRSGSVVCGHRRATRGRSVWRVRNPRDWLDALSWKERLEETAGGTCSRRGLKSRVQLLSGSHDAR
jgi:hypothetical protein